MKDIAEELAPHFSIDIPSRGAEGPKGQRGSSSLPTHAHDQQCLQPRLPGRDRWLSPGPLLQGASVGGAPPQNLRGSQEPADIRGVSVVSSLLPMGTAAGWGLKMGSGVVQSQQEICYGRVS